MITLFMSLFIFSGRVEAIVMWMKCDYDGISYFNPVTKEINFIDDITNVVRVTNSNGVRFSFSGMIECGDLSKCKLKPGDFYQVNDSCWINNANQIDEECSIGKNATATKFNLDDGMCPGNVRTTRDIRQPSFLIFAGKVNPVSISEMNDDEYVFYSVYSDKDKKNIVIGEGYEPSEGKYAYVNRYFYYEGSKEYYESPISYQIYSTIFKKNYGNFWKVTDFNSQYVYVSEYCSDEEDCMKNKDYKVILSSKEEDTQIEDLVAKWYSEEGVSGEQYSTLNSLLDYINDKNFMSSCNNLINSGEEGKIYNFSDGYTASQLLNRLESVYNLIVEAYNNRPKFTNYFNEEENLNAYGGAYSYVFINLFQEYVPEAETFEDLLVRKDDDKYILNHDILNQMLLDDISEAVDAVYAFDDSSGSTPLEIDRDLDNYTQLFLEAVSYLKKDSEKMDLSGADKERLETLKKNFTEFAGKRDIFVVVDCEDLISDSLRDKIKGYLNIVNFAVAILLMGLGILDFIKAVFAGDEDAMKKAQKKFLQRIVIAVIFFLVPTIVNFILSVANEVWNFITPGSCGIFD